MKVLVVDDSAVMRRIIVKNLASCGIDQIVEAADGNEGFAKFNSESIDLVMTDWNMPERNGLDLVNDIRSRDTDVPIIMVTTESEKAQVVTAMQAGANDYLAKPFGANDLRRKLEKFIAV